MLGELLQCTEPNANLKSEKADAEINDMAKKIRLENETKKLTSPDLTITLASKALPQSKPEEKNDVAPDWTSVQGQFGWEEIESCWIPYLTRSGKKYASETMVNLKLFGKYNQFFSAEVHGCYDVRRLTATFAEVNLLNEINTRHCDSFYGRSDFTANEKIISMEDVKEMNEFYAFCYERMRKTGKGDYKNKRGGFVKIDNGNCVPYVNSTGTVVLPLFYFEVDAQYMEEKTLLINGWDLAYLKFACKFQGIRKELCDKPALKVIPLSFIKEIFTPNTTFEELWVDATDATHLIKRPAKASNPTQKKPHAAALPPAPNAAATSNQPRVAYNNTNQHKTYQQQFTNTIPTVYPQAAPSQVKAPYNVPQHSMNRYPSPVSRYVRVPEYYSNVNSHQCPYKIHRVHIDNKVLQYCVNGDPFVDEILLVSLEEIAFTLLLRDVNMVARAFEVLSLTVYIPNKMQIAVLQNAGLYCTNGMIQFKTLTEALPQLKYYLKCN